MSLLVNLFGGPGSGKSTTRAGVFHQLKLHGWNCEEVTEYAKNLTWGRRYMDLACQAYVFGKQLRDIERVIDQVDVVITDSPLLLSLIYKPADYPVAFDDFVLNRFNSFTHINVFLERVKPFNPAGRNQSEEESNELDEKISKLLIRLGIPHARLPGDEEAVPQIVEWIENLARKSLPNDFHSN